MKLVLLAVLVFLSASCADGNEIVSPPSGPSKSLADGGGLFVIGQTIGPNGEIWQVTGGYELCGTTWKDITWNGKVVGVKMDVKCAPSQFSSWDAKTYDGGIVNVLVQSDNGYVALGWVSADLSKEGSTFNVPSGAAVRLSASLNPGCELSYWNTDAGQFFGNPLDIPANSTIGNVEATFYCSQ
jgi:hypothetical protein